MLDFSASGLLVCPGQTCVGPAKLPAFAHDGSTLAPNNIAVGVGGGLELVSVLRAG